MALADIAALAVDADLGARIKAALADGAVTVLLDPSETDPTRLRFAQAALHQLDELAARVSWGVAARLEELGQVVSPTDVQVRQALLHVFPAYAGRL